MNDVIRLADFERIAEDLCVTASSASIVNYKGNTLVKIEFSEDPFFEIGENTINILLRFLQAEPSELVEILS